MTVLNTCLTGSRVFLGCFFCSSPRRCCFSFFLYSALYYFSCITDTSSIELLREAGIFTCLLRVYYFWRLTKVGSIQTSFPLLYIYIYRNTLSTLKLTASSNSVLRISRRIPLVPL